ncbi:NAD(P)-binding domain-containing protein [Nocardia sp. NPDC020380]|uniref:NAD(P)-binding domain-containing protein n=1 Tax=Nocardia sp. NPDC020380 TaxID=3364309 RepID=UPI0037A964F1
MIIASSTTPAAWITARSGYSAGSCASTCASAARSDTSQATTRTCAPARVRSVTNSVTSGPSSAQMQQYLESYVDRFSLQPAIRLETEVTHATPTDSPGWSLTVRSSGASEQQLQVDHLVVANGVYSDPAMPEFLGAYRFRDAGYRICHAVDVNDLEAARGKSVVIVGYGKTACDIAAAVSEVAAETTVVARRILWKMPAKLGNVIGFEQLELCRQGEAGFAYLQQKRLERLLHGPGRPVLAGSYALIQAIVTRQLRLRTLGLLPDVPFEMIAESTEGLATEGFFDKVAAGSIAVLRDTSIIQLLPTGAAELSNGTKIPAELVICATGYRQRIPFIDPQIQARIIDEKGNFRLYRNILPPGVPDLTFAGYNSSGISVLGAEIGALWTAGLLTGRLQLPPAEYQYAEADRRLAWMEARTNGKHAHGGSITPFSIHNIDEMLNDLGSNLGPLMRAWQWVAPLNPRSYRKVMNTPLSRSAESTVIDDSQGAVTRSRV